MAVQAWPFAGPNREWGATEWRQFMVNMRQQGILADVDSELLVEPVAEELRSVVRPGIAFIAGHQVVIDADETVDHDTADLEDDRIDLVVLTTDWTDAERRAYVEVLTGTPAAIPAAPGVTQDDVADTEGVWQEPLAEVLIETAAGETGGHSDLRTFMEVPGRLLKVADEAELADIDPTFHRMAVVAPGTGSGSVRFYNTDTGEWDAVIAPPSGGAALTTNGPLELYVDPAQGNDLNPGTESDPLETLDAAWAEIPLLVAHDVTVHLVGAEYVGPVDLGGRIAIDRADLTLQGDPGGTEIVSSGTAGSDVVLLRLHAIVGMTVSGIDVGGPVQTFGCSALTLADVDPSGLNEPGMVITGGDAHVTGCTVPGLLAVGASVVADTIDGSTDTQDGVRGEQGATVLVTDGSTITANSPMRDDFAVDLTSRIVHDGTVLDEAVRNVTSLLAGYAEEVVTLGTSGTQTLDFAQANVWRIDPTGSVDIEFDNLPESGEAAPGTLIVENDSEAITWPSGTLHPGGDPPELDGETWLSLVALGGGAVVVGAAWAGVA